jgi:hypothetical protein
MAGSALGIGVVSGEAARLCACCRSLAAIRHCLERISARRLEFGSAPMVLKAAKPTPKPPHPPGLAAFNCLSSAESRPN